MDYNATTPLEPEVIQAITEALQDAWGNPSSSYIAGKETCFLILSSPWNQTTTTSLWLNISRCQSQSNDQPVQGKRCQDGGRQSRRHHLYIWWNRGNAAVVRLEMGRYWASSRRWHFSDLPSGQQPGPPHSRGALLEELQNLRERRHRPSSHYHLQRRARFCQTGRRAPPERKEGRWEATAAAEEEPLTGMDPGFCRLFIILLMFCCLLPLSVTDVTFVPVSRRTGRVEVEEVVSAVRANTCLVSIMLANNETGVIMVRDWEKIPRMSVCNGFFVNMNIMWKAVWFIP